MAATAKVGTPALLTTTPTAYATVTAGTTGNLKEIVVCNVTGAAQVCSIYVVPASGSATTTNAIINALSVASGTTYRIPMNTFLEAGGTVQAAAGAGSTINIRVSWVEFS